MRNCVIYFASNDFERNKRILLSKIDIQYFLIAQTLKDTKSTAFIRFVRDKHRVDFLGTTVENISWRNIRTWAKGVNRNTVYEHGTRPKLIYAKTVNNILF